jgi:hypothetical protein
MILKGNDNADGYDMGFTTPPEGTYIWMVKEGIDFIVKDDGSSTIMIPISIVDVIDGSAQVGESSCIFAGTDNKYGERVLLAIMDCTETLNKIIKKLGADIDPASEEFLQTLQITLVDKIFKATHELKDFKGKEVVNFTNFKSTRAPKTVGTAKATARSKAAQVTRVKPVAEVNVVNDNNDDEDWD